MQRKKSPEEIRRKELISELVKVSGVKTFADVQAMMKEAMSETLQNMLEAELEEELGYSKYDYRNKDTDNSRNGYSNKRLQTSNGEIAINVPRDRQGEFEPVIVEKHQTRLSPDIEEQIISMYAKGMTQSDISGHIKQIYGFEISESVVSRITDKVMPIIHDWQQRPLENTYAVVFMDAIHYHVRQEGRIIKKAVYTAIGLDLEGKRDVLGLWVGENESAKYWLTVLNELKNRGLNDILIACTDNLTGFAEAIAAAYPQTDLQHCIIHQIRNSTKYVSWKDLKAVIADLKLIYRADTEKQAYENLESFREKWDSKYPKIYKSWHDDWANLTTYFAYPPEIRKIIYTTNQIENFNRQLRKVTKTRSVFPNDDSLLKLLYLAINDITQKWTGKRYDWRPIRMHLEIYYGDRIP
ncbi:MAG: IS256 family transposase [Clostridiaceae bacterium]|jgi:putative transposase|nr:IS256 family transposase [Clostridiaceae bacterium]